MSGVAVATRMRSISSALIPACSMALSAALGGHVAGAFILRSDAAFLDPGARGDPLVARIDHAREVLVRDDFFRHVTARYR